MTAATGYAALACVVFGLVAGPAVLAATRDARLGLRVALDLWLAAGLLRLATAPGWDEILAAAAVVAIRQLAGSALGHRAGSALRHRAGGGVPGGDVG